MNVDATIDFVMTPPGFLGISRATESISIQGPSLLAEGPGLRLKSEFDGYVIFAEGAEDRPLGQVARIKRPWWKPAEFQILLEGEGSAEPMTASVRFGHVKTGEVETASGISEITGKLGTWEMVYFWQGHRLALPGETGAAGLVSLAGELAEDEKRMVLTVLAVIWREERRLQQ